MQKEEKMKVFVVVKDVKTWEAVKHFFSYDKRVEVYPKTEVEFKSLNSMVLCSLNSLIHESIVKNSYENLKATLDEKIFDESLLVIDYTLFDKAFVKIGASDFLEKFIFNKFQLPIMLLVEEKEKHNLSFLKSGDIATKKADLNRHLFNLFYN